MTTSVDCGYFTIDFTREGLGEVQLIAGVLMYGVNLVGMREAMLVGATGPFTFTAITLTFAAIIVSFIKWIFVLQPDNGYNKEDSDNEQPRVESTENTSLLADTSVEKKTVETGENWSLIFLWGSLMGVLFFAAAATQEIAMVTASAGMTAFICGMFVVFVPIMELFLSCFAKSVTVFNIIAMIISVVGLFLVSGCAQEDCFEAGVILVGEYFALISMVFISATIIVCDIGVKVVDPTSFTQMNFIVAGLCAIIVALIVENDEWTLPFTALTNNYAMCILVGFTQSFAQLFCSYGQRYVLPTKTSLILCLQAISAAVLGYIFLQEDLTFDEIIGCCLMTLAAVLSAVGSRGFLDPDGESFAPPSVRRRSESPRTSRMGSPRTSRSSSPRLRAGSHSAPSSNESSPESRRKQFHELAGEE